MKVTKVGVVGCGNISSIYFQNGKVFDIIDIVGCTDLVAERAQAKADEFGCKVYGSVAKLLADPDIDIILNLTIPIAHASVAQQAVEAGKSVYNEKPLTITRAEGKKLLETAKAKGVRVGGAPDTFMGGGIQTCVKLINDGWIGEPIGASAFMMSHGHEGWHPDPEFYYKVGGGPMFDMGPYYLTALVALLGPMKRITGSARITFPERIIGSEPKRGEVIKVDVPTHVVGVIDYANGAIGTIIQTFDVWAANLPRIEVYGTEGSMVVPDPNSFGGDIQVRRAGAKEWASVPHTHGYGSNARCIGVADMAYGLQSGRKHRANGEMAYHVLDAMHAFHDASDQGKHIMLESTCDRPAPLPLNLRHGTLDE